jgi:hypothetical protein
VVREAHLQPGLDRGVGGEWARGGGCRDRSGIRVGTRQAVVAQRGVYCSAKGLEGRTRRPELGLELWVVEHFRNRD